MILMAARWKLAYPLSYRLRPLVLKCHEIYTLGFKSFEAAEATISGIELHRMLKKEQMENAGDRPACKQFYELAA
jgi:transposase-like protein